MFDVLNYGEFCVVVGRGGLRGGGFNNKSVGGVRGGNFGGFGKF